MSDVNLTAWLDQQCRQIPGVRSGFIASVKNASDNPAFIAWPGNQHGLTPALEDAVKSSLTSKKSLIRIPAENTDAPQPTLIATPLDEAGLQNCVAIFRCDTPDAESSKALLLQLRQSISATPKASPPSPEKPSANEALTGITQLLATSLAEPEFKSSAMALCADLAEKYQCQRVSLGVWQKQQHQIIANSQHAILPKRANHLNRIAELMNEAADQKSSVTFPATGSAINAFHREYAAKHQHSSLFTVPLLYKDCVIGALCFERGSNKAFDKKTVLMLEHISSFLAPIIQLKYKLSLPWFKHKKNQAATDQPSRIKQFTLGIALLVLITCAGFISTLKTPFDITATAHIEGAIQRAVTVPVNGFIKQLHARPGDEVKQGDLLIELEDNELRIEKSQYESELAQLKSDYRAALAGSDRTRMMISNAQSHETSAKLELINKKLERTRLYAPFDAEIIDGDLVQALGAPVKQGETLMTLAPKGNYRIILEIPESDIGFVEISATGEMALKSNPQKPLIFSVTRITPLARAHQTGNIFEAQADITNHAALKLRPGLEGLAKISVGEKPWIWQSSRRLRNWFNLQLWRWKS